MSIFSNYVLKEVSFKISPKVSDIDKMNIIDDVYDRTGHGPRIKINIPGSGTAVFPFNDEGYVLFSKMPNPNKKEIIRDFPNLIDYICGIVNFANVELIRYSTNRHTTENKDAVQNAIKRYEKLSKAEQKIFINAGKKELLK